MIIISIQIRGVLHTVAKPFTWLHISHGGITLLEHSQALNSGHFPYEIAAHANKASRKSVSPFIIEITRWTKRS